MEPRLAPICTEGSSGPTDAPLPIDSAEATALTDYFAASSGAEFPYHSDPRARAVRQEDPARRERLDLVLAFRVEPAGAVRLAREETGRVLRRPGLAEENARE